MLRSETATSAPRATPAGGGSDLAWLHGVRAVAALYVVLHHVWLIGYRSFPDNVGPPFLAPLVYGHLAVAVFIVVSGYSLTLAPRRNGLVLRDGATGFLRRRFWRIVPPYWISLALSSAVVWIGLADTSTGAPLGAKDVALHGLLLQDAIHADPPNGVFWSIAVEWHIYFLFPLLLLLCRRRGRVAVASLAATTVIGLHLLSAVVPTVGKLDRFTPQFLVLFVLGMVAATLPVRSGRTAAYLGGGGFAAVVVWLAVAGPRSAVSAYFWVDLAVGAATAALFVALAGGRLRALRRVLSARPTVRLGEFAFSIYLVHGPLLAIIGEHVVPGWSPAGRFLVLLLLGVPVSLLAAWLFFLAFERPFLTIRSFGQLRGALAARGQAIRAAMRRDVGAILVEPLDEG